MTTIVGSGGTFEVDEKGFIVGFLPEHYAGIKQVDMATVLNRDGENDVLCVGYWYAKEDGTRGYESPEPEALAHVGDAHLILPVLP